MCRKILFSIFLLFSTIFITQNCKAVSVDEVSSFLTTTGNIELVNLSTLELNNCNTNITISKFSEVLTNLQQNNSDYYNRFINATEFFIVSGKRKNYNNEILSCIVAMTNPTISVNSYIVPGLNVQSKNNSANGNFINWSYRSSGSNNRLTIYFYADGTYKTTLNFIDTYDFETYSTTNMISNFPIYLNEVLAKEVNYNSGSFLKISNVMNSDSTSCQITANYTNSTNHKIMYSIDGFTWNLYTSPFSVINNCTINFKVLDESDNEIYVKTVLIDKIKTINKKIIYTKNYDGNTDTVSLALSIQNGSSTDYIEYSTSFGENKFNLYVSPLILTQNCVINVRAFDEFGNEICISTLIIDDIDRFNSSLDDGFNINSNINNLNEKSSLKDIINSVKDTFSAFSIMFSFLPNFIWALISVGLTVLIVMRILGR